MSRSAVRTSMSFSARIPRRRSSQAIRSTATALPGKPASPSGTFFPSIRTVCLMTLSSPAMATLSIMRHRYSSHCRDTGLNSARSSESRTWTRPPGSGVLRNRSKNGLTAPISRTITAPTVTINWRPPITTWSSRLRSSTFSGSTLLLDIRHLSRMIFSTRMT